MTETFELQGASAGLVTRCVANVVDFVVVLALLTAVYLGVAALFFLWDPRGFSFPAPSLAATVIVSSVIATLYFAVSWSLTGRTYGDHVLGVRVVTPTGRRLRPSVAFLRAVAAVMVPIGLLWAGISRRNRSLQDVLVHSSVVYDWDDELPPPSPHVHIPHARSSGQDDASESGARERFPHASRG